MKTEKICFRYDGSEEAKQALKWLNNQRNSNLKGSSDAYYYNVPITDGSIVDKRHYTTHRLVSPAEFLRIVNGETKKPYWTIGSKCTIPYGCNGTREKAVIIAFHAEWAWVLVGSLQYFTVLVDDLRPVSKSLKEEVIEIIGHEKADQILQLIKQRKDEL